VEDPNAVIEALGSHSAVSRDAGHAHETAET
jgi:hypothetical protein